MDTIEKIAKEFAAKNNIEKIEYFGKHDKATIYIVSQDDETTTGFPEYIIVNINTARFANEDERQVFTFS